jgi:hypothetical protein
MQPENGYPCSIQLDGIEIYKFANTLAKYFRPKEHLIAPFPSASASVFKEMVTPKGRVGKDVRRGRNIPLPL